MDWKFIVVEFMMLHSYGGNAFRVSVAFLLMIISALTYAQQNPVGLFDAHTDVGTNVKPGSATFIKETGQYVVSGAGYNIWDDHDEFQFVWKKMKGDFILSSKVEFLGPWVDYHRKMGWMVRKSLDGNSPHVNAVEHGDDLTSLQFRMPKDWMMARNIRRMENIFTSIP